MYKNYLTHQFAIGFERSCFAIPLPMTEKSELLRCSKSMVNFLTASLYVRDRGEKCKHLFVSLTYLRDCWDILKKAGVDLAEIEGPYVVLQARLEQLCLDASSDEQGQLRMLG